MTVVHEDKYFLGNKQSSKCFILKKRPFIPSMGHLVFWVNIDYIFMANLAAELKNTE